MGCAAAAGLAAVSFADVAFSGLVDGSWRLFLAKSLDTEPMMLSLPAPGDALAPRFRPAEPGSEGPAELAVEVAGSGVLVWDIGRSEQAWQRRDDKLQYHRPCWDPRSGDLVVCGYRIDAGGEDSEIFRLAGKDAPLADLVRQTGSLDFPAFSSDGLRLVYVAADVVAVPRAGAKVVQSIWVLDAQRGDATPVTFGAHQDIHPRWSPDGRRIAFASNRSGQFEIWSCGPDGSELRQITSGQGVKTWPAWSPDGRSLLFTRMVAGRFELWTTGRNGSGLAPYVPFGPDSTIEIRDADWK